MADGRAPARVPRRLDQQPAGVRRAGLGDRALPARVARGALGGHEPDEAHELFGRPKAGEVADLADQPDGGQRVDAAQAAQPPDQLGVRAAGGEPRDLCLPRAEGLSDVLCEVGVTDAAR
jgi:hypothetical protein